MITPFWKIGLYLRLSKEDGDKDESDSIASQRILIQRFIRQAFTDNYKIVDEFIDDGCTGTNFERPGFLQMIGLIDREAVNCVIVKDLSRFGRDYIGAGQYLENYFPLKKVRFIAVNDGYDSFSANAQDDFIMPIKNIFNAQYSKDISRKVKSSFRSLQSEGKFIGAFPSYGYEKDPNDRHKLMIDEPAAMVVRRIFDLYNHGQGKLGIARILNREGIPCPSEYKRLNGFQYTNGQRAEQTKYWTYSTIHTILRNEMYTGSMVQNKSLRKTVHGKAEKNAQEDWIVVKNTHEPIISEETWNMTQQLLDRNTRQLHLESGVGLFAGYLFCGNCGRSMSKVSSKEKNGREKVTYICGSYKRYGSQVCTRNSVPVQMLEKLVLEQLNEQIEKAGEIPYVQGTERKWNCGETGEQKRFATLLEKNIRMKKTLYEDYKEGILSKEEYLQYKNVYLKEEELLKGQLGLLQNRAHSEKPEQNQWLETLLNRKKIELLDRETVAEVLDKIVVTPSEDGVEIKIIFRFVLQ
ncbi:MAG: recombinase family protein [Lachnospiraceae bacterium]